MSRCISHEDILDKKSRNFLRKTDNIYQKSDEKPGSGQCSPRFHLGHKDQFALCFLDNLIHNI
jgi:hypothetical protein